MYTSNGQRVSRKDVFDNLKVAKTRQNIPSFQLEVAAVFFRSVSSDCVFECYASLGDLGWHLDTNQVYFLSCYLHISIKINIHRYFCYI